MVTGVPNWNTSTTAQRSLGMTLTFTYQDFVYVIVEFAGFLLAVMCENSRWEIEE